MAKRVLVGAGVGTGVAFGRAFVLGSASANLDAITTPDQRLTAAAVVEKLEEFASQLETEANSSSSETAKQIITVFAFTLRDPELLERIKLQIAEGATASRAVSSAIEFFSRKLVAAGGPFAERAQDLIDLSNRVVRMLDGRSDEQTFPDEPFILIAESISPMDAAALDPTRVLAVVTSGGSPTSHSAIITRAANLPTVVGVVGAALITTGTPLIVDATSGQVFIEPRSAEFKRYSKAAVPANPDADWVELDAELPVKLYANLGSSYEGAAAIHAGALGVGLFRTELLYLGRTEPPSFEQQVYEYSRLFARFQGKRVIARVLDLDDDKPLPFLSPAGTGRYANRGLQVLLANREVLITQLEALAKAASYYPKTEVWVMAPMVLSADEALEFVELAKTSGLPTVGAMVEVPEFVEPKTLDRVVEAVDFLSIGTNDLTNFVLNTDRQSVQATLADVRRPEVLEVIAAVTAAAAKKGIPVSVCGESASDPESARIFIDLGVDSLSASPALLPQLRVALASMQMFG
jgi:phosphotransferase system enzyme I (PtsI)